MFGFTFFIYRIGYHVALLLYLLAVSQYGPGFLLLLGIPTLAFHCFWFFKWLRSYRAKLREKADSAALGGEGGSFKGSSEGGDVECGGGPQGAAAVAGGGLQESKIHPPPDNSKVKALVNAGVVSVSSHSSAVLAAGGTTGGDGAPGGANNKVVRSPPVRNKERQA